ncbi:MAG TPA: bifunctional ornithine acetyltransferase/N-acetylglutamate synthase, partial [Rhizomicrobium sp.]|nr:bifunctional ornithine acetyltransferase/N-acetylglutamate synthase [Rhizomicrobium sp.]
MANRKQSKSRLRAAKDSTPRSPLAPKRFARLPPLAGARLATAAAGIRYRGRDDLLLVSLAPGTQAAGVFTQSKCASAPVEHCRKNLPFGKARALVVNSGNANAYTGRAGAEAARAVAGECAAAIGCDAREVYLASTGVIGEPLPFEKITRALPPLAAAAK